MSNETSKSGSEKGLMFYDSLDYLLLDCRSGDPSRYVLCQLHTALGALAGLVLPVFIVAGLFGNSLTAYIYLWKLRPWSRQGVYFSAIALSDNCNLVMIGFWWMFLAKGLPWVSDGTLGYFHVNSSSEVCTIVRYFEQLFYLTSSTLFLAMVVDRVLSVYFPFKFQQASAKSGMRACLAILLVDAIITIPMGVMYTWIKDGDYTVCFYDPSVYSETVIQLFTITGLLLYYPPTLLIGLIFITNLLLIIKMRSIIIEQRQLMEGGAKEKISDKLASTVICVILSTILLICSGPMVYATIRTSIYGNSTFDQNFFAFVWGLLDISQIFILFNQSTNWIVLLWRNVAFRTAFISIFKRSDT